MTIKVNLDPLESGSNLPYFGYTKLYNNSDWMALYQNPRKAQRRCGMVLGVLVKAGATVRAKDMFYKVVLQAVLMYGSEIWVITEAMMKVMEGFHYSITQRISGNTEWKVGEEGW